jgi:hypothetical protein
MAIGSGRLSTTAATTLTDENDTGTMVLLKMRLSCLPVSDEIVIRCAFVYDRNYATVQSVAAAFGFDSDKIRSHWYCPILTEKEVRKYAKELKSLQNLVINDSITTAANVKPGSTPSEVTVPIFGAENLSRYAGRIRELTGLLANHIVLPTDRAASRSAGSGDSRHPPGDTTEEPQN